MHYDDYLPFPIFDDLTEEPEIENLPLLDAGYTVIVPVSGGKDSQAVLSLAIEAGHNPVCVHQNTGYDHPYTYQHLADMEAFYGVKIHHTVSKYGDMWGFLEKAKYFPNSAARGCTQRLKQEPFAKWLIDRGFNRDNSVIWFGMRSDESVARGNKYGNLTDEDVFTLGEVSNFYNHKKHRHLGEIRCRLPIVSWTTEEVFSYLKDRGAPINKLYLNGHHRVGCYPCLLARKAEWLAAAKDCVGRQHIERLLALEKQWEEEGNPRKFTKVHRNWDVRKFLLDAANDIEDSADGCGWCSI